MYKHVIMKNMLEVNFGIYLIHGAKGSIVIHGKIIKI